MTSLQQAVIRARSIKFDEQRGKPSYCGVLIDNQELTTLRTENDALRERVAEQQKLITSLEKIVEKAAGSTTLEIAAVIRPKMDQILRAVSAQFNIPVLDLLSDRRGQKTCAARQVAMYLAKKMTLLSSTDIGKRIGNRDHSTILYGAAKVELACLNDADFAQTVKRIEYALVPIPAHRVNA